MPDCGKKAELRTDGLTGVSGEPVEENEVVLPTPSVVGAPPCHAPSHPELSDECAPAKGRPLSSPGGLSIPPEAKGVEPYVAGEA